MTATHKKRVAKRPRGGFLLPLVLFGLAVAMTIFSLGGTYLYRQQRQLRLENAQLQADCFAQSGIARAKAQLGLDAAYTGEAWYPSGNEAQGDDANGAGAKVEITVERASEGSHHEIRVVAIYPHDANIPLRSERTAVWRAEREES